MMRSVTDVVDSYLCHGCGACAYYCPAGSIEMKNYPDAGMRPHLISQDYCAGCSKCLDVCSGIRLDREVKSTDVYGSKRDQESWGPIMQILEGWSNDDEERYTGSSGGIGTAIGRYALASGAVDAVLHVVDNEADLFTGRAELCRDSSRVISAAGSRYNPVSLCSALTSVDRLEGKVLIIGKPCEIAAVSSIRKFRKDLDDKIALMVSIFCGGTPSSNASKLLCERLDVMPDDVESIRYRGHGWPGNFSIKPRGRDERAEMSYQQAWGEVLTSHISFRCSICPDGTGEFADISIGDPWYKDKAEDPLGSSLILARTPRGREFLQSMIEGNAVTASELKTRHLYESQLGLQRRKQHVFIKIFWLWLFFMDYPRFGNWRLLRKYLQLDLSRILKTIYTTGRVVFYLKRRQSRANRINKSTS